MGRRKAQKEEGQHEVIITVTIAKASFIEYDPLLEKQSKKAQGKSYEAPKAQNYFHSSYKLLPDDKESTRADVVTFGIAAKLYTDSDSRVLRTWTEGEKTWVAWTNSHKIKVTKDVLLKMFNHTLELKIWDSKDKVSPKARFDRPKAFKFSQAKANEEYDIDAIKRLLKQQGLTSHEAGHVTKALAPDQMQTATPTTKNKKVKISEPIHKDLAEVKIQSDKSPVASTSGNRDNPELTQLNTHANTHLADSHKLDKSFSEANSNSVKVKVFLKENKEPEMENLMKLASSGIKPTDDDYDNDDVEELLARQEASRVSTSNDKRSTSTRSSKSKVVSAAQKKLEARAAYIKLHGLASVPIKLSSLFTGTRFVSNRLENPAGSIEDLVITLSLDTPLLSEPQKKVLNPLVISVRSASNMPSYPLSYELLQSRCLPSYICYKFYDQPVHQSRGKQHAKKITFDDTHVVLLGIQDKEKLFEYLRGPPLAIEVHDRDRNTVFQRETASVFGQHEDDSMICNASLITSRRTEHNAFTGKDKPWDPYGVAKLDLSELLLGEKILERTAPIKCCKIPDVIDGRGSGNNSEKIVGKPGSVDGPEDVPMPSANYLEFGSELKLKVELAYPLRTVEEIQSKEIQETPVECPFAKLVYIFDYNNTEFLQQLQNEVMQINAESLQLKDFPPNVIEAALSTYKLNDSQRSSKVLDIVTGFQVIDGKFHIFVLEGLRDHGIKKLWENLPHYEEDEEKVFKSLYNSGITFQERLYASLDVDLTRVRLHQPLDEIVKLPLLYVRDMIPRACFEAVVKLHELTKLSKLRDAVRNEYFPTAEMIASLSKEFGIPLTTDDLQEFDSMTKREANQEPSTRALTKPATAEFTKSYKTSRPWTPLEIRNTTYEGLLKERESTSNLKDFLTKNISNVRQLEPIKRERTITCDPATLHNKEAHNYSIQSLNTTEKAKQKLREYLAEEPDCRYTYSQGYNTATILPVEPGQVKRDEINTTQDKWRTPQGFVFPGHKTSREANKHDNEPDFARLDELKKPWKENILHANILKPTVDRIQFSWEKRKGDFDLWTKPPKSFGEVPPVTIHLAGDKLAEEKRKAIDEERTLWQKSLVAEDTKFNTHRCCTGTELRASGFKSSSQVARLQDILKDEPKKYSLSAPSLRLRRVPALSVVLNPTVDSSLKFYERLQLSENDYETKDKNKGYNPGPLDREGWLLDKNKVPVMDYNHDYFNEVKGGDFRLYHKPREPIFRRQIKPLTREEQNNHLFLNKSTETV